MYDLCVAENEDFVLVASFRNFATGGVAFRFDRGEVFNLDYIANKMGTTQAHAAPIAAFMRKEYRLSINIPKEYDQSDGRYLGSPSPHAH
jgi:hypothetical protein